MFAAILLGVVLFLGGVAVERSLQRRTPLFLVLWIIVAVLLLLAYQIGVHGGLWS